jgi:hypothetical protein
MDNESITAAMGDVDYLAFVLINDRPILIHALYITQNTLTGDANEEMIRWAIITGHNTLPGSAITPTPMNPGAPTYPGVARKAGSAVASGGTPKTIAQGAFNVRTGLEFVPERPVELLNDAVGQGGDITVVRQLSTLSQTISINATVYLEIL